jgi:hypothetical protein
MFNADQLVKDYKACVAEANTGLYTRSEALRTAVALHPDMTRAEWVAFAVAQGGNKGTANNRFSESRKVSAELDALMEK